MRPGAPPRPPLASQPRQRPHPRRRDPARSSRGRGVYIGVIALALGAVAVAVVTQRNFDMQPCPWCVLQRALFVAIAIAALPGLIAPQRWGRLISAALIGALSLAGVAAALWQHFVAAATNSCAMTLADRIVRGGGLDQLWPEGFSATASCADAAVRLLGIPYEFYSLALFAGLAVVAGWLFKPLR